MSNAFLLLRFIICLALLHVVNVSAAGLIDSNFWGFHVHEWEKDSSWQNLDFQNARLWDSYTSWRDIESTKGKFDFGRLDRIVSIAQANKLKLTLVLGNTPEWASSRPTEKCAYGYGCAAEPASLEDWGKYVSIVARRYKGKIECYEIWNEVSFPNEISFAGGDGYFYSGNVQSLVSLARNAYEIIKAIDPNACVLSPSFHSTGDWFKKLDLYLKSGGGKYADAISFHFYYGKKPEETANNIAQVKIIIKKNNLSGLPIWNTEFGDGFYAVAKKNNEPLALTYSLVMRTLLLNAAGGVSRLYWYAWDDGILGLKPSFQGNTGYAYQALIDTKIFLTNATVQNCKNEYRELWHCELSRSDGAWDIYWNTSITQSEEISLTAPPQNIYTLEEGAKLTPINSTKKLSISFKPILIHRM